MKNRPAVISWSGCFQNLNFQILLVEFCIHYKNKIICSFILPLGKHKIAALFRRITEHVNCVLYIVEFQWEN